MDAGSGGCCIARYDGATFAAGVTSVSKVDSIMLKFRPIAPKPSAVPVLSGSTPDHTEICSRSGRGKRRYTGSKRCTGNITNTSVRKRKSTVSVVTLPLLPETPERKEKPADVKNTPVWLGSEKSVTVENNDDQAVTVWRSCVTVECLTDTWVDGNGLGLTDDERMTNLFHDTCPGFISDGGTVTWTNKAYKEMAGDGAVWLVMKEKCTSGITSPSWKAVTCRARMQCGKGKEMSSLTVPCDVWRMDGGGFAWRLDVDAALCLGRMYKETQ